MMEQITVQYENEERNLDELLKILVVEHRHFCEKDLSHFHSILQQGNYPAFPDAYVRTRLQQALSAFEAHLRAHFAEEEHFIYPALMHVHQGIALDAGTKRMLKSFLDDNPEGAVLSLTEFIEETLRLQPVNPQTTNSARELLDSMHDFARRLKRHANIETDALYPLAESLLAQS